MNVTVAYAGHSQVVDRPGRQTFSLVPNLTRDPVAFDAPVVARVEIKSGKGALGTNLADVSDRDHAGARDLVVMDDFIYGEPRGIE